MITRSDVVAHLERGMRVNFLKGNKEYSPIRSGFCRDIPSDGAFETYADMGAVPWPNQIGGQAAGTGTDGRLGSQQVGGLLEGGPVTVLGGNERSMVVYNQDFEITVGIYHTAINDNRVNGLDDWAQRAGWRFEQHKDYLAISALNSGDAATYGYGYDKQELFCATHADPGAEYTTAQDNEYDLALSLTNFETVKVAASKFLDDRGKPVGFMHNLLVVPTDLEVTARNITDNREDYSTTDRKMNPYAGLVRPLVVPGGWLDSAAWFLVDDSQIVKPINLQVRQNPELVFWDDETQGLGIRYYKWTARYVPFYGDWRLVVMGDS